MTPLSRRDGWTLEDGVRVRLGEGLHLTFQRARRVQPADVSIAAPSYGVAAIGRSAQDHADVLIPLSDEEAVWIGLSAVDDASPCAARVIVRAPAAVDAVTGTPPGDQLAGDPQNYVVIPPQFAVAGVSAGPGVARQFVRDARSAKDAPSHLLEIAVHTATRRVRSKTARRRSVVLHESKTGNGTDLSDQTGFVLQRIAPDPYGIGTWSPQAAASIVVALVAPDVFVRETGQPPPGPLDEGARYHGRRFP